MFTMSGLKSRLAMVAVGRSILMDCRRIMLRLASMKEASRKNMMSIRGMISMRAFLCGSGDPSFIGAGGLWGRVPRYSRSGEFWRRNATVSNPFCLAAVTITSTFVAADCNSNSNWASFRVK